MKNKMIALYDYNLETVVVLGTRGVSNQEQLERKFFDVYSDFHTKENILIFRETAYDASLAEFGERNSLIEIDNKNNTNKLCFQVIQTSEETASKDFFIIKRSMEMRTDKMKEEGVLHVITEEVDMEDLYE